LGSSGLPTLKVVEKLTRDVEFRSKALEEPAGGSPEAGRAKTLKDVFQQAEIQHRKSARRIDKLLEPSYERGLAESFNECALRSGSDEYLPSVFNPAGANRRPIAINHLRWVEADRIFDPIGIQ
jgi:hypothetical protein